MAARLPDLDTPRTRDAVDQQLDRHAPATAVDAAWVRLL
jgi:hypothetical protein